VRKILHFILVFAVAAVWGFAKYKSAKLELAQATMHKQTLHLFAMSDYFPANVIKEFESKNNCEVRYDNFSSNEELLAKLQAGATGYDVIVPSDYMVQALIANKLITSLDKAKIPNFHNLGKDFVQVPFDPGSHYSVAYTWGTTGLIFNTKFVKGDIDSWDVLFKKEYSGHISILDDEREVLGAMLQKLGYSVNTTNKTELLAAQKLLISLKPHVRLFASDPKQHLLSGDVWISQIYSGDAHQVMKTNPELHYVVPKEGGIVWIDTLAIPQRAQHEDLAYAFINTILDPSVAAILTEQLLYSSPNQAADALITDEKLRSNFLRKLSVGHLEFLKDLGANGEAWDQLWTEAKSH
jgi:spermidine/putrescine transport system substrate-binding protein